MRYDEFLTSKAQMGDGCGFEPVWLPDFLFDFQRSLVEWAIRKGRGALFEDCGLGKTPQQLVWAENVVRHTNKPVLILTPLAVAQQTIAEAEKFGIEARRSRDGAVSPGINVTNYERLHHFRPVGLTEYAGERKMPSDLLQYRGYTGNQIENRYSHWIWRQYASAFWDDIRIGRVLPFKEARDDEDEKHVHPLQLDVIDRVITLWSNPGETVLTPFMGVGSEVYGAVCAGRLGIGAELKPSYYRQAVKNVRAASVGKRADDQSLLFAS